MTISDNDTLDVVSQDCHLSRFTFCRVSCLRRTILNSDEFLSFTDDDHRISEEDGNK